MPGGNTAQSTGLPAAVWQRLAAQLNTGYAYGLARQMEQFKTNPVLGYRTAGSRAEFDTGEFLAAEMRRLGLTVEKDAFTVDGWDFHHAQLRYTAPDGIEHFAELGGYQTDFHTGGPQKYTVVNAGRGTAEELEGLDLHGKLALITINQRDEWWINYPAYQAHLHGAAAVLAVQHDGYGKVDERALNAQDICGPAKAAAFSISRADARVLTQSLGLSFGCEAEVWLDAESTVTPEQTTYNIIGKIEGQEPDSMVMVSAHYDSYFEGFQDDNTAVAMMLGIARAILLSGYRPQKTLLFCCMAAEEWGVIDSRYDWSTGAYNQLFRIHPDWSGKVIADINLELPAHRHGKKHRIRSVYELRSFLREQIKLLPSFVHVPYDKGIGIFCPVQTWSDDFSIAIAGVPSMVNEFGSSSFMETTYHSQFDNDDAYDEQVYAFHHQLYSYLLMALDRVALPPLNFSARLLAMGESLTCQQLPFRLESSFRRTLADAREVSEQVYRTICRLNSQYAALLSTNSEAAHLLYERVGWARRTLFDAFRFCEDQFVKLDWNDASVLPHENAQNNLLMLHRAAWQLDAEGDAAAAVDTLGYVDINWYVPAFEPAVVDYFIDRALNQPPERLMWGAGRLQGLLNLSDIMRSLHRKELEADADFRLETAALKALFREQLAALIDIVKQETSAVRELIKRLQPLTQLQPDGSLEGVSAGSVHRNAARSRASQASSGSAGERRSVSERSSTRKKTAAPKKKAARHK